MSKKIKLPPGWKVVPNACVGFDFVREHDGRTVQHPVDNDSIRRMVWKIHEETLRQPNDVNILTDAGVRLRIVSWDMLPHLQYKMGDRECYVRIQWEEFRRFTMGEYVDDVLPWFHKSEADNFREEKP